MAKQFTCPKCGSEAIELRYFRYADTREERLSCQCDRCRYRWNQPVIEEDEGGTCSDAIRES
jgi:DNA-directed RNA polymerase subunit M/transcription elongation factor TFIIS